MKTIFQFMRRYKWPASNRLFSHAIGTCERSDPAAVHGEND